MSVKVDTKQEAPRIFPAEDAIKMKLEAGLSDRQLFAVLRCIRATVESYGGAITPNSVVYCVDVDLLINRIVA